MKRFPAGTWASVCFSPTAPSCILPPLWYRQLSPCLAVRGTESSFLGNTRGQYHQDKWVTDKVGRFPGGGAKSLENIRASNVPHTSLRRSPRTEGKGAEKLSCPPNICADDSGRQFLTGHLPEMAERMWALCEAQAARPLYVRWPEERELEKPPPKTTFHCHISSHSWAKKATSVMPGGWIPHYLCIGKESMLKGQTPTQIKDFLRFSKISV